MINPKKSKFCLVYYQNFNSLVYREALSIIELGYTVDIFCLKSDSKERTFSVVNGINIYKIHKRKKAEKKFILYVLSIVIFFIKMFLLFSCFCFFKRYEIIHVTSPPDFMVYTSVIQKLFGAKIILDIHDIGPELMMRKLNIDEHSPLIKALKIIEKLSSKYSDHVITVTHIWRDLLLKRSVKSSKCSVLLNVPDENLFTQVKNNFTINKDRINLSYHGTIEEHFGVDTLLRAMPLISKSIKNVHLNIYCNKKGRYNQYLNNLIIELNIKNVNFYPAVSFKRLPEILKNMDVGIVPTKGGVFSDDAVSMKSLEYLSLGIPIVISNTKGHRYYYNNNFVKFFEKENHVDLANAVIELCKNEEMRKKQSLLGLYFIDKIGWKNAKIKYCNIVKSLTS